MKFIIPIHCFLLSLVLAGCAEKTSSSTPDGWISLFNGKDLRGWEFKAEGNEDIWSVIDGVIDCQPRRGPGGEKSLWSSESFKDFELHVEWRLKEKKGMYDVIEILPDGSEKLDENGKKVVHPQPGADSGIYLRGSKDAQINIWCWPIGSGEIWGYRHNEKDPIIRAGATPKVKADNPLGEWNTFHITLVGDRVTVVLNDQTVIDRAHLPRIPEEGPIVLQHHGGYDAEADRWSGASSLVQFRNIRIKPLDRS